MEIEEESHSGVGKAGKYCPFRPGHKCGTYCGLWCAGLNCCVFHAMNKNLGEINSSLGGMYDRSV